MIGANEILENHKKVTGKQNQDQKKNGVWKRPGMRRLLLASMLNRFGDSIDMLAFSWLVYQVTGTPAVSALVLVSNYLPSIFLQPFAGALVERRRKKWVMALTDCGRVLLVLVVLLRVRELPVWLLLAVPFFVSVLEAFRNPAMMAYVPELLRGEDEAAQEIPKLLQEEEPAQETPKLLQEEEPAQETPKLLQEEEPAQEMPNHLREEKKPAQETPNHLREEEEPAQEAVYDEAAALLDASSRITELAGTGAAGILVAAGGVPLALMVDIVCFLGSAVLEAGMHGGNRAQKEAGQPSGFWKDFLEGLRFLRSGRSLLLLLAVGAFLNAVTTPLNALQAPLVSGVYGRGSEAVSVIGALLMLGMFAGALLYRVCAARIKTGTICLFSGILNGMFYGALVGLQKISAAKGLDVLFYVLLGGSCFVFGCCIGLLNTTVSAMLMKNIPKEYLSRVFAWVYACATAAVPGTSLLLSALLLRFSVSQLLLGFGVLAAGAALLAHRAGLLRRLDEDGEREVQQEVPTR